MTDKHIEKCRQMRQTTDVRLGILKDDGQLFKQHIYLQNVTDRLIHLESEMKTNTNYWIKQNVPSTSFVNATSP